MGLAVKIQKFRLVQTSTGDLTSYENSVEFRGWTGRGHPRRRSHSLNSTLFFILTFYLCIFYNKENTVCETKHAFFARKSGFLAKMAQKKNHANPGASAASVTKYLTIVDHSSRQPWRLNSQSSTTATFPPPFKLQNILQIDKYY